MTSLAWRKVRKTAIGFFGWISEAVRTRYRIAKHSYELFYKERIQATLASCVYNEGRRKKKQQPDQEKNEDTQQQASPTNQPSTATIICDGCDEQ